MIIRDANANLFIVFGGLFSRKVIEGHLREHTFKGTARADTRSALGAFYSFMSSGTGVSERSRLQPKILELVSTISAWKDVERTGTTGDLLCLNKGKQLLIEVKVQTSDRLDEAKGSGVPYAEDQLIRDLNRRKIPWGILTNGWSWRFYNKDMPEQTIEFCLADIARSTISQPELDLFCAMLEDPEVLARLHKESAEAKTRSTELLSKNLRNCYLSLLGASWEREVAVRFLLRLCAQRFLEDCGILNVLDRGYQDRRLDVPDNFDHEANIVSWLCKVWKEIGRGRWTIPTEKAGDLLPISEDFFTNEEQRLLKKQPEIKDLSSLLRETFVAAGGPIDCSDLNIEFFGSFYQLVEDPTQKNDSGRYFTNLELARRLSVYLSERFARRDTLREGEYILDPACGSGQLLRLLIPYAMNFVSYDDSAPTKLEHWRRFSQHLAGLDIDENCVWIAKVSLWLATAAKGRPFVRVNVRKNDVISSCIGKSRDVYGEALGFSHTEAVVAIITNPPWEELRIQFPQYYKKATGKTTPKQRDDKAWQEYMKFKARHQGAFDKLVDHQSKMNLKIRQCFGISGIPNLAEVFLIICRDLLISMAETTERSQLPYAIILPDQFFLGTRMAELRKKILCEVDCYIPFARNIDPNTGKRYFHGVDPNRRFGIILGKVNQSRSITNISARPLHGMEIKVPLDKLGLLPLHNHPIELTCLQQLVSLRSDEVEALWNVGEWDATAWNRGSRKIVSERSPQAMALIKAEGLGLGSGHELSFRKKENVLWWVHSKEPKDVSVARSGRLIIGDTKRNAGKIVRAGYVFGSNHRIAGVARPLNGVALQNTLLYAQISSDWLPYFQSLFFEFAMRSIAGAQHLNAWRLNLLGIPRMPEGFLKRLQKSSFAEQQRLLAEELKFTPSEFLTVVKAAKPLLQSGNWVELLVQAKKMADNDTLKREISELLELEKKVQELEKKAAKKKSRTKATRLQEASG